MIHTEPDYVPVTPEMKERFDRFYEEHKDDPLGDVATRLLFEDERVRIWEMKLEPGEAGALHRHDHDYYLAMCEGDLIGGIAKEGMEGEGVGQFVVRLPEAGNTIALTKGLTEWAINVGTQRFRELVIELKDT